MEPWEKAIKEAYQSPEIDGIDSYYFSLDGGGRDLIVDAIEKYSISLMLEIGSFLCGSTIQWLKNSPQLRVIGVDPWDSKFADILDRYNGNPVFDPCFEGIPDRKKFIDSVRSNGPYASALANVKEYGDRFIPVKAYSPSVLHELKGFGLEPDLIYFDSNKLLDDMNVCRDLFPNAILSGDDWTWGADQGLPVQQAVNSFCKQHSLTVDTKRATWIINP